MRYHFLLNIDGKMYVPCLFIMRCELSAVGWGEFEIESDVEITAGSRAVFSAKLETSVWREQLAGVVTKPVKLAARHWSVTVREYSLVLDTDVAISLVHPSFTDVMGEISRELGLKINVPKLPAYDEKLPHFVHTGSARRALRAAFDAWNLIDAVWYQIDGKIWVGRYADSERAMKMPVGIHHGIIQERSKSAHHMIKFWLIPSLRPGAKLKLDGQTFKVDAITTENSTSEIKWTLFKG